MYTAETRERTKHLLESTKMKILSPISGNILLERERSEDHVKCITLGRYIKVNLNEINNMAKQTSKKQTKNRYPDASAVLGRSRK